jgi:hypothetical protein
MTVSDGTVSGNAKASTAQQAMTTHGHLATN